ncbi:karyogamy protein, partial [Elsinoe ampelina]
NSRAGSIYSLSRVSFTSRLAQLTSIPLPTASSLQARISSQTTAHLAARTLSEAGDQIRLWTKKASDVLQDLDAQDDVEWSAAGGAEGLEEVDQAISRFEGLVKVYVISIEELQMRSDVKTLSDETLQGHVEQMEGVIKEWQKIKQSLKAVKDQVEIALEWEEMWNSVLGEIAQELGSLSDLIFEMEEKRHQSAQAVPGGDCRSRVDLDDLANVMDRRPSAENTPIKSQVSLPAPFSPNSPIELPTSTANKDDSKLLALFARMQPLRASLDFLPMRLSAFHTRGNALFPSGCIELESRRDQLENQWRKLETDAEALRKELGEDRWLVVFRNAGRQALKMFESVERSVFKLNQNVANGSYQNDAHAFARMAESFEAKKTHYVPAIDRVLSLIDRGVMDRLSVNGEILRLQSDMKRRYKDLQADIKDLDELMVMPDAQGQQLRDSISTILSSERSRASSILDSPRSSPASSVMIRSRNSSATGLSTPTGRSSSALPKTRRPVNLTPSTPTARPHSRLSDAHRSVTSPFPRVAEPYIGKKADLFREFKEPINKPRWNAGSSGTPARDFLPLSATEPSPYRKTVATPRKYTPSRVSQIPELGRTMSPAPATPSSSRGLSSSKLP